VRRVADLAGWLQQRCPSLWALGVAAVRQRWGEDVHPLTVGGAGLVLALQQVGVMQDGVAVQQLQPFERLEGLRQHYIGARGGAGFRDLQSRIARLDIMWQSDEQAGRKERLRARRARFLGYCGAGRELQRYGAGYSSEGDPGAPATGAPRAKAGRGRKGKQRAHKDPDRTGGRTGGTAPKTGNPGPKVSDPE
jgi:hypothetical protein